ncbi:MAG: OsmC family protein [Alistipes sp.]|jgi:putative redox protein|nr:OsmC family protein [Alistipes sp.]MEE0865106.1 OsmC family protein [Alistipes sp.]
MTLKITISLLDNNQFKLHGMESVDGLTPKELMLYAAAKCAGLTVLSILKEHTSSITNFEISIEGRLSTPTPVAESRFLHFNIIYNIECPTLKDQIVISRAVNLAHDKYCGVLQMYRQIAPVMHETSIVSTEDRN